jgi:hypothetical protein
VSDEKNFNAFMQYLRKEIDDDAFIAAVAPVSVAGVHLREIKDDAAVFSAYIRAFAGEILVRKAKGNFSFANPLMREKLGRYLLERELSTEKADAAAVRAILERLDPAAAGNKGKTPEQFYRYIEDEIAEMESNQSIPRAVVLAVAIRLLEKNAEEKYRPGIIKELKPLSTEGSAAMMRSA